MALGLSTYFFSPCFQVSRPPLSSPCLTLFQTDAAVPFGVIGETTSPVHYRRVCNCFTACSLVRPSCVCLLLSAANVFVSATAMAVHSGGAWRRCHRAVRSRRPVRGLPRNYFVEGAQGLYVAQSSLVLNAVPVMLFLLSCAGLGIVDGCFHPATGIQRHRRPILWYCT